MFTSAAAAIADNVGEGEDGSVVKRPEGCDLLGEPGGRPSAVLVVVLDIVIMLLSFVCTTLLCSTQCYIHVLVIYTYV